MILGPSSFLRKRFRKTRRQAVAEGGRVVVVLEPNGECGLERVFRLAKQRHTSVCILSLGYPQSQGQQDTVRDAMESAWKTGVRMEAVLVMSRHDVKRHLLPGDDVIG